MGIFGWRMREEFLALWRYRDVTRNYVSSMLRVRYRRSFLGYLWTMMAPMINYLIIGFALYHLRGGGDNPDASWFLGFMLTGSVYFGFLSHCIVESATVLIGNEHFIRRLSLPKSIYVLNMLCYNVVNFLLVFAGLMLLNLAVWGAQNLRHALFAGPGDEPPAALWIIPGVHALFVPVAIAVAMVGLWGITQIIAVLTIYFRDLTHILPPIMQAAFFATPIFFHPDRYHYLIRWLNPFYHYVQLFRAPIIEHRLPDFYQALCCVGFSILLFFAGTWFLRRMSNKIIFKM